MTNAGSALAFSTRTLRARLTRPGEEVSLSRETIVVNPSGRPLTLGTDVPSTVAPLTSALLDQVALCHPDPLLLVTGRAETDLADLGRREGWTRIGDDPAVAAGAGEGAPFPPHTPLWRSPIERLGTVVPAPEQSGARRGSAPGEALRLQANLWYAPAGTDCHIHRRHEFLEVHTQIAGRGRMQKFHAQDASTLYQDVPLEPGSTHAPFCSRDGDGGWIYPWHRYWADTDCLWLALEYHPL